MKFGFEIFDWNCLHLHHATEAYDGLDFAWMIKSGLKFGSELLLG